MSLLELVHIMRNRDCCRCSYHTVIHLSARSANRSAPRRPVLSPSPTYHRHGTDHLVSTTGVSSLPLTPRSTQTLTPTTWRLPSPPPASAAAARRCRPSRPAAAAPSPGAPSPEE